jgi:hypothetical protein
MEVNESCLTELDTFSHVSATDDTPHTLPGKGHDWTTSPVSNILRGSPETHIYDNYFNSALVEWVKRQGESP